MLKFKFPKKCPSCDAGELTSSKNCIIYDCGGKISVITRFGDLINCSFKNCSVETKAEVKTRFSKNNEENKK